MLIHALLILSLPVRVQGGERPATGDELVFRPAEGLVLEKHFELDWETSLEDSRSIFDGEPSEGVSTDETVEERFELRVVDTYSGVNGGVPAHVLREFETLGGLYKYRWVDLEGEEEDVELRLSYESDLQGVSLGLLWDAESEVWERESLDPEVDPELVAAPWEGSEEDLDFRFLLPDGAVQVGDRWELDPELLARMLMQLEYELAFTPVLEDEGGGLLELAEPEGAETDDERGSLLGEASARYLGSDEDGGRDCGKIELTIELHLGQGWSEVDEDGDRFESASTRMLELQGEALWDLAGGHLRTLDLEGSLEVEDYFGMTIQVDDEVLETENYDSSAGSFGFRVRTRREG